MEEYFDTGVEPWIVHHKTVDSQDNMEEVLAEMQENLEKSVIFKMTFAKSDKYGNLAINVGGCTIKMLNEDCVTCGNGRKYNPRYSLKMLERQYMVMVKEIDMENKIVYVSHAVASKKLRRTIIQSIKEQLKRNRQGPVTEKKRVILPARVVDINDEKRRIMLDICGYAVAGIITNRQWKNRFSGKMSEEVEVNDWIDVEVLSYQKDALGPNTIDAYICSRKTVLKQGWNGIEERYAKNDMVSVVCRKKRDGNYSFMGEIEGETIDVLCVYSRSPETGFKDDIVVGSTYQGKVISIDEKKRRFKVRIFRKVEI